jgi:hypothetical protein
VQVESDRTWRFAAPPADVWEALAATDDYRAWWPWLRRFDAGGLVEGEVWNCTVKPPLPYALTFTLAVGRVEPGSSVEAVLGGDLRGTALLDISSCPGGSDLRLRSRLAPARPAVALFAGAVRPLARWGHDWVLDTGVRQFAAKAVHADVTRRPS